MILIMREDLLIMDQRKINVSNKHIIKLNRKDYYDFTKM